jgi:N12 class adenine-specific DNA methylase/ppGpp synthetase/RelA/SpoT-type nucleotidyltranferase
MVTKTADEMTDAELEQYLAERKSKKVLTNSESSNIMTSRTEEKEDVSRQRPPDTTSEGHGLPEKQPPESVKTHEPEGTSPVRLSERETGDGIRQEPDSGGSSGTGSMESGNSVGNIRERERLDNNPADKAVSPDNTEDESSRSKQGRVASGRVNSSDLILNESSDIGHDAGPTVRWQANVDAITTLKKIESEGRNATPEEQRIMTKFSGWGDSAFGQAFPANENYRYDKDTPWGKRRDELKAITTPEEFKAIEKSRENAFFTTPEVIKTMWKALDKAGVGNLTNPRVLEPSAGSGRFLGYQPPEMAAKSQRIAVELDDLTGRMLKQMYPQTEVYAGIGFEKAPIPKESIDVAISNVPFGNYPIFDPSFKHDRKKLTRSIHNYFFAKTLGELRPGGMLAFITSHQTLDAPTHKAVRQALAKDADLVEAIRLPNNAFPDTSVVTDIIIMKKRMPGQAAVNQDWIDTVETELTSGKDYYGRATTAKVSVNKYFMDHPENVLGVQSAEGTMNKRYGGAEYTVSAPAVPLANLLERSVQRVPANIITNAPRREPTQVRWSGNMYHENAHVVKDNIVYVQHGENLIPANFTTAEDDRVKRMLSIRDAAKNVVNIMVRNGSNAELEPAQKQLDSLYKEYVLANGALTADKNSGLLSKDPDAPFLRALEDNHVFRILKNEIKQADARLIKVLRGSLPVDTTDLPKIQTGIFTKRVIHGYTEKPVTDYADAESVVKNETGRLDIALMAKKLSKTDNEVIAGLIEKKLIFKNPENNAWEPAEEYLTGDVRGKLKIARAAANGRPQEYDRNVDALQTVQPDEIPAADIGVRMGAPWIPGTDINQFVRELLDAGEHYNRRSYWDTEAKNKVQAMMQYFRYNEITGEWQLAYKPEATENKLKEEFGTQRMPAHQIIERILNGKLVDVKDTVTENGKEVSVRNDKETIAAQEKASEIQRKFQDWIWNDAERTERLAKEYNDKFNNFRPRIFDGQHQALPGIAEKWAKTLHSHSKDAIWRILQDRTALLAHEVGFGKTAVMVTSGMELRRLGLAQKPLYVVPKATHEQFRDQFLDIYPYANVLYPEKDDFSAEKRKEFVSRAITGDHDAIILSYEQFEKIPVRPETEAKFLQREMDDLQDAIMQEIAENTDPNKKPTQTQKEIAKVLDRAKVRMQELNAKIGDRSDKTVYFDDLGVDQLYVDEADSFKNLHFVTRMGRVKGLPNGKAQRAWDMYTKTRFIQEDKNNGVVFATGTPIANTIAEMYTMMRYLQEPMLEKRGLQHFDAWAKTFGETTESLEQTPTGKYKMTQRFSNFQNAPELSRMWQQVADIRVADEVPAMVAQRPRIVDENGKQRRSVIPVPPDKALLDYMETLAVRAEHLKGKPEKGGDNMLKISGDARKAALDMRIVNAAAPYNPSGKISVASSKIAEIYNDPFNKANKGTQLVFLDMGTPKAKPDDEQVAPANPDALPEDDNEETTEELSLLKDVYSNVKKQLVANGVPENEIAFIHDAKTQKQRTALFAKVNSGDIRVIIGSTGKMGAGVNIQDRACALHHLDAPWRPRDIEQREGRVIRAGNKVYGPKKDENGNITDPGKGVKVYTYVTERSFDEFMWQAIEKKAKSIKAIMRRQAPPRSIEDVDSFTMSAAEAKAIASGNPDVMKAATLKNGVLRLQMLKSHAVDSKVRANYQLKRIPELIQASRDVIKDLEATDKLVKSKGEDFAITVGENTHADNKEGVVDNALKNAIIQSERKSKKIGEYKGLDVNIDWESSRFGPQLVLQNPTTKGNYPTSVLPVTLIEGTNRVMFPDNMKLLSRLDNAVREVQKSIEDRKREIENGEKDIKLYTDQANKQFEYEDRLNKMQAELTRTERRLQGQQVEDGPSDNYIAEELPEDTEPGYHYSAKESEPMPVETVNPEAVTAATKAEISIVEKENEVKAPAANIEKIVEKMAEPALEVQETIANQRQDEVKEKVSKIKIGDELNILGIDSVLADSQTVDGVKYDIFNGASGKEKRAVIRVTDIESGNVVTIKPYATYDEATKDYSKALRAVGAESPTIASLNIEETVKDDETATLKQVAELKEEARIRSEKAEDERKAEDIERKIREAKREQRESGLSAITKEADEFDLKLKALREEREANTPAPVDIDAEPPNLPEIKNAVDTTKEKNVVYGALNDTRNNADIARDMHTDAELVDKDNWDPNKNDLPGWDTTDIKEYHDDFEKAYPGLHSKLENTIPDGELSGRVKTLESVVKKLKKKNAKGEPFTQNNMEDIIGMRLTFDNQKDILDAASKIKTNFKVTQDEDYITNPKDGYRSYHLTVEHDGKPAEIQLRTPNQTRWADWMHDTFYDHPAETKAQLGEDGFKRAKEYSLAMGNYYAKLDRGEPAVMPEGLPDHPEFKPKGLPEPIKVVSPFTTKDDWPGMVKSEVRELPSHERKQLEKRLKGIGQAKDIAFDMAIYDKGDSVRKLEAEEKEIREKLNPPTGMVKSDTKDEAGKLVVAKVDKLDFTKPTTKESAKPTSTVSKLKDISEKREPRALTLDNELKHAIVIQPTDPEVAKWKKDPGSMDVQGVDTPVKRQRKPRAETEHKPKAKAKHSKTTLREYRELNAGRSARSIAMDNSKKHGTTVTHNDRIAYKWKRDPGSMDILKVDSGPGVTKPTHISENKAPGISQRGSSISRGTPSLGRGRTPRISNRTPRLR